jgi:hypothetical protein
MNKEDVDVCTAIMKELYSHSSGIEKEKYRNKLYLLLQESIIKWMCSILKSKAIFISQEEILSQSWDCFLFCLKYYNLEKNIPILNHFYAYTKFFLLLKESSKKYLKNKPVKSNKGESGEGYSLSTFECLDDLKSFRESLPEDYKTIFDDSFLSMGSAHKDRVRRLGETSVKYYQYHESKKIFRIVIDFLLRR